MPKTKALMSGLRKARSRATVKYKEVLETHTLFDPYLQPYTAKKGSFEIHNGFNVPFILSRDRFLEEYEVLE